MFGFAFSKAAMAALVASPSLPRPWVAKTIVWVALAGTCELALGVPEEELQAAAVPARPASAAASARRRAVPRERPFDISVIWRNTSRDRAAAFPWGGARRVR